MNLAVSFLDGYVDSGAHVADMDRITWDVDYIEGFRQRIIDDREWEAESWTDADTSEAPAHSDLIYNADHRARIEAYLCDVDNPTVNDLQMMYVADRDNYRNQPGFAESGRYF